MLKKILISFVLMCVMIGTAALAQETTPPPTLSVGQGALSAPPPNGTIFSLSGKVVAMDMVSRTVRVQWNYLSRGARSVPNPVIISVPTEAQMLQRGRSVDLTALRPGDWISTHGRFSYGTPEVKRLLLFAVGRR